MKPNQQVKPSNIFWEYGKERSGFGLTSRFQSNQACTRLERTYKPHLWSHKSGSIARVIANVQVQAWWENFEQFGLTKSDQVDIKDVVLTLWPYMFIQAYLSVFLAVDVREPT